MALCKEETDKVLLVEGLDDCHVVMSLCAAYVLPDEFGIYECGSDDAVLKRLNALILRSNRPTTIGAMLDADNPHIEGRWRSIRDKLAHYSYTFPAHPEVSGTIVDGSSDEPRLGFWLMPNNRDTGMLEDFCLELASPAGREFAEQCVAQARANGVTAFSETHRSKAVVHTYLAWQEPPGRPLGQAITAQALQPRTPLAETFVEWLKRLFL